MPGSAYQAAHLGPNPGGAGDRRCRSREGCCRRFGHRRAGRQITDPGAVRRNRRIARRRAWRDSDPRRFGPGDDASGGRAELGGFNLREDQFGSLQIGSPVELVSADGRNGLAARVTEIVARGEFATWRAAQSVGDHDLNTFLIRADLVEPAASLRPRNERLVGTGAQRRTARRFRWQSLSEPARTIADVAAAEAYRPVDPVDRRISATARLGEIAAEGGDAEDPAASGHQPIVVAAGAGMKILTSGSVAAASRPRISAPDCGASG